MRRIWVGSWRRPSRRAIVVVLLVPLLAVTAIHPVPAQRYFFVGQVYEGEPPQRRRPARSVSVGLYGDQDEWPESGPREFLTSAFTDEAGVFALSWESGGRFYPYLHVIELDPHGAVSTGADVDPPGSVKNLNVVSYLDIPPGEYINIVFWDRPAPADAPGPSTAPAHDARLPDLAIARWAVTPEPPSAGGGFMIEAAVGNQGEQDAGDFFVNLSIDGLGVGDELVAHLAAGAEVRLHFRGGALAPGVHAMTVAADPDNWIREVDETNNEIAQPLRVGDSNLPDLTIESVTFSPERPVTGSEIKILVSILNPGTGPAEQAQVAVSVIDTAAPRPLAPTSEPTNRIPVSPTGDRTVGFPPPSDTDPSRVGGGWLRHAQVMRVPAIAPGGRQTASTVWGTTSAGNFVVRVEIDPFGAASEAEGSGKAGEWNLIVGED